MKQNKLLKPLLAVLLLALLPQAAAAYDFMVDGLCYNRNSDSISVTVTYEYAAPAWPYYSNLSGNLVIPETVTYSGTTYSVTSIGGSAFRDCSGLTSVTIPYSVTSIGGGAFRDCSGLTSVTIPNSVTSIGTIAFDGCSGIKELTWNAINCTSRGNMPTGSIEQVTIGDGVEVLPGGFVEGSKITSVTIPNSVTSIGNDAFRYCSGLTSVTIGNSVTAIDDKAFEYCSGLTSVTIPNSVTSIGNYAFEYCSGLTSVTIGNSVTAIGYHAFLSCSGLNSVTIGNSVTTIGGGAFWGCSIKELTWNAINCSSMGDMPTGSIEQVTIGDEVEVLPGSFVSGSKITSVTIPNSVTSIGQYAFKNCSGLTSVTIPNSVTSIGNSAFSGCSGLTSVTIPNSVTSIGRHAFAWCSGLKTIFSDMNAPQNNTYGGGITEDINKSTCILYVPVGTVNVYRTVSPWNEFENILEWHRATSLDLNDDIELFRFESDQLQVEMHPSNAVEPLIWSSSDNNIVTVDNNGIVTGIAPGTATVVAKTIYGTDVSASCTVTVLPINCDVNHDGTVDVADVNAAINVMLERSDSLTAAECDINGDTVVDIFDVNMIIGEMLGNGNLPEQSAAVKRK